MRRSWRAAVAAWLVAAPAAAQSAPDLVAAGRAVAAADPAAALALFTRALAADSLDYEANWRAAVAVTELGEADSTLPDRARDSLERLAQGYARRAVRADSSDVNGHFALAMALGRAAQRRRGRAQLEYVEAIHAAALQAFGRDPLHDGVHHVLGLWNAEVMRASGFTRFLARNVLGARVLGQASWDNAIWHLEQAVALDSTRIYHRLDLARVYVDRERYADARRQLAAVASLPDRVHLDPRFRAEAARLLQRIGDRGAVERPRSDAVDREARGGVRE